METSLVISELKTYLGITKDSDLANYLGIKQNTLANWKARNTLDVELIVSKCEFLNPTWLLTGEGSMLKSDNLNPKTNIMDDQKLLSHLMSEVEYLRKKLDESETERKELRSMCDKMLEDLREFTSPSDGRKKKEAV